MPACMVIGEWSDKRKEWPEFSFLGDGLLGVESSLESSRSFTCIAGMYLGPAVFIGLGHFKGTIR